VTPELVRDLDRPAGWWLLVGGSEQSFVDVDHPLHLEFEYVQMIAYVLDAMVTDEKPLTALHLGGGLLTVPRWLAARHPGSRQTVAEHSRTIARLAAGLGPVDGVTVVVDEADTVAGHQPEASLDVVVCDLYDGPETVTGLFTLDRLTALRTRLRTGGCYVCNLSDASPFALAKVVAATLRTVFDSVALLGEPAVLRGRRSGNIVLLGTDRDIPVAALTRLASGGPLRARVLTGMALSEFIGGALPAGHEADLPASGESPGRSIL
jgi:hypothetical protein